MNGKERDMARLTNLFLGGLGFSVSLVASFWFSGVTAAAPLHVPADYAIIQEAIDQAEDGDTILIAPGTYYGSGNNDLTIIGKSLMVASEEGPGLTIVESGDDASVLCIDGSQSEMVAILGITIKGTELAALYESAIRCQNVQIAIIDCIVQDFAFADGAVCGGALWINEAEATLLNCLFSSNQLPCCGAQGAGIYAAQSTLSINNCTIRDNRIMESPGFGGGIYCTGQGTLCSIADTICWGNNSAFGSQLAVVDGAVALVHHSIIQYGQYAVFLSGGAALQWGQGNLTSDPWFVTGPYGGSYLSHQGAGQQVTSPGYDTGSALAVDVCYQFAGGNICLDSLTTRTDHVTDHGMVNLGYHYRSNGTPAPTVTTLPTLTETPQPQPTPTCLPATPTPEPSATGIATATPSATATLTPQATAPETATPQPPETTTPTTPATWTEATPTPTPEFGAHVRLNNIRFQAGDHFLLVVEVYNPGPQTYQNVPLGLVLSAFGAYYFHPTWTTDLSPIYIDVPLGGQVMEILEFIWPSGAGNADNVTFYCTLLNEPFNDHLGIISYATFGWE